MLLVGLLASCHAGGDSAEASPLVGTWKGTDLMEDTYEFRADGTGQNESSLLSYDFKYETEGDKLNIFAELFGMESDEPMVFTYSINGDTLTLVDESIGVTYEFSRE